MDLNTIKLNSIIPHELSNKRLDQALAQLFPQYSRSQLQNWVREGYITIDGKIITQVRTKVNTGQIIQILASLLPKNQWYAQDIPLNIIYEDDALIVVNKPVGLVVHPGAGINTNTLVNALLHYAPELKLLPRAGIIHRLDKDTSGLLVIARTLEAHLILTQQMKQRKIEREYEAIAKGNMIGGGTITANIGRHPLHRTRMAVLESGRLAITHYRVIERFRAHTHLHVKLETGRTHQIRVHLAHIHHPLVGDGVYGTQIGIPAKLSEKLRTALKNFQHQALHAVALRLTHPTGGRKIEWHAPLPADFINLLVLLKEDTDS